MNKKITIREFDGGICEIEAVPDEPGRNWVKVRLDHKSGAGFQFEVWDDEMHHLERSISCNFSDGDNIATLPLDAPPNWKRPKKV